MPIDAHFHIWELEKYPEYEFPTPEFPKLNRNYTIEEYEDTIKSSGISGAVFVQVANNCPDETEWLCELAKSHPIIKGVVGGLTLNKGKETLQNEIERLSKYRELVGVRYVLNYSDAKTYLQDPATQPGFEVLQDKQIPFDLVLYPYLLESGIATVRKYPKLNFMIDHMAKPMIRDGGSKGWEEGMKKLAEFPNVYCKVSGLVTEADLEGQWTVEQLKPYVQRAIDWFGAERCVFGSDWPVCLMNADNYGQVFDAMVQALPDSLTPVQKNAILEDNARKFYGI